MTDDIPRGEFGPILRRDDRLKWRYDEFLTSLIPKQNVFRFVLLSC